MNPVLFVICVLAVVYFTVKYINRIIAKKDAEKAQKRVNENVEWQLMDGLSDLTISVLAKHSDKEKIASIVSSRINDYLRLSVHPYNLYNVFKNLGLTTGVKNNASNKEIELSALIQHYVLRNVDSHDLECWQIGISKDRKEGYEKLNHSFLSKCEKNQWIWSPVMN
ncbi:hypothetical protein K8Q96_03025 [Candidatus Nomurabacteria bacterium]|nr:hypothetical protein [Candidatus Nomurabacteria bacterium]